MELAYLSKARGIWGGIKETPSDFVVSEISDVPAFSENGRYCYFCISKEGKSTEEAVREISRACGIARENISCGGQKDRQARTRQLASALGLKKEALEKARLPPSLKVEFAGYGNSPVKIGRVRGNSFKIRIMGVKAKDAEKRAAAIFAELGGVFPNYFGQQRFGQRGNNHIVGKLLVQGSTQSAAEEFLFGKPEGNEKTKAEARKRLAAEGNYSTAMKYFPASLSYERMMLSSLADNPNDYVHAFICLPRPILLLFVHAYQSHLFNLHLSERVKEGSVGAEDAREGEKVFGSDVRGFPAENSSSGKKWLAMNLIGTESKLGGYEKQLIENDEVRQEDFRICQMPMLGAKGGMRSALAPINNFSFDGEWMEFALPSGSYATSVLREFMKN